MHKLIPSLGVSDINRTVTFYNRYFDFEIINSFEEGDQLIWCQLRSGQAELMLQQLTPEQQIGLREGRKSWVIYVSPEDIDGTHERLVGDANEVSEIDQTSYGTREFFVDDPDGYELWVSAPSA